LPKQIELMPVRHAAQAVRFARERFIDAALLDLELEDSDGWQAAERLLAEDTTVRLLLAAEVTGRAELVANVSTGVLLEKPVNAVQVVDRLTYLLRLSEHGCLERNASLHNFLRYAQPLHPVSRKTSNRRCWVLNE